MHSASIPTKCAPPRSDAPVGGEEPGFVLRSFQAMGCRFEFMLDPRESGLDRSDTEAIADELVELVLDWHDRLTVFSPVSIISRINLAPPGQPVRVDPDLFELLRLCENLRCETAGAFNIAAGTLMHAHGFRGSDGAATPDDLDLDDAVCLDPDTLCITRNDPRVSLDLGAIAKGHVLDLIGRELRHYGIAHAFIHGGTSSSIAMGQRAPANPWRVRLNEAPVFDALLRGVTGLGISEITGRSLTDDSGVSRGHIMDPRTNRPAEHGVARVACTHPSAAIADAYSTALNVRPDLLDTLHEHGCSIVLFPTDTKSHAPLVRDRLGVFRSSTVCATCPAGKDSP